MKYEEKIRVHLWDQMILIAFALALFYSVFDSVLYLMEFDVDFIERLLGPDRFEIWSRLTILCLFTFFGAHAQYTINQRKAAEVALRESEKRFRKAVLVALLVSFVFGTVFQIVKVPLLEREIEMVEIPERLAKLVKKEPQHSCRPQVPKPPTILAWWRTPICLISTLVRNF